MIDNPFRSKLALYVSPFVRLLSLLKATPNQVTLFGFGLALVAAYLVSTGVLVAAIAIWWLSRFFDGLDGIYARATGQTSDFGAFLDIQLDMLAYSAMVVAFYLAYPQFSLQWILMLMGYVLCISGALGLGNFEKKQGIKDNSGRGLRLAMGLAEGGETGIAYTVFLLFPDLLGMTTWIWLTVLLITIVSRLILANQELRGTP